MSRDKESIKYNDIGESDKQVERLNKRLNERLNENGNDDPLSNQPLYSEFITWVNDGVTVYEKLPGQLRKFLYESFINIVRNMPNREDYKDLYLSENKNADVWMLQFEPGKSRPKWKQVRNNIGYSDSRYFTVRHVLESIPLSRTLTKGYRELDREEKMRRYLIQNV